MSWFRRKKASARTQEDPAKNTHDLYRQLERLLEEHKDSPAHLEIVGSMTMQVVLIEIRDHIDLRLGTMVRLQTRTNVLLERIAAALERPSEVHD